LKYGQLPELERRLQAEEEFMVRKQGTVSLLSEEVTEDEIARIISRWTGIPLTRLIEGERDKLMRLEKILHERVIGQDEAVTAVADAVIRARAGIKNPQRPIGSFLFLGPTGGGDGLADRAFVGRLAKYAARMGVNPALVWRAESLPPGVLHALTPQEIVRWRLAAVR